jgi:probable HAF family extracellular repeat protein
MNARQTFTAALTVVIAFASVDVASAQTARAYRVEDLGTLGGQYLVGTAINNSGEIVGYGYLADGTTHAFRWSPSDGLQDIAPGGHYSAAYGINDGGDIVGFWFDEPLSESHAFLLPRGGVPRDVAPDVVRLNAILNDGRMAGFAFVPDGSFQIHAFRMNPDNSLQDIDAGNAFQSGANAMNDLGQVTGYVFHDGESSQSAFRFSDGSGMEDLGTLGGTLSVGLSINHSGVVVGGSEVADPQVWSRAFRARPGFPIEDLGTLGSGQVAGAEAINNAGAIVGWSQSSSGMTSFLYTDIEGMIDLATRIPRSTQPWGQLTDAVAINGAGQIVVQYQLDERTGTYRLTPVVDRVPPTASAAASPASLWPPNGRMIPVSVNVTAADDFDPAPACAIASVVDSEAPSHGIDPAVGITGAFTVSLRAWTWNLFHPRTYTIRTRCTDFSGNSTDVETVVVVQPDGRR